MVLTSVRWAWRISRVESYISLLMRLTPPRLAILRMAGLAEGECCVSFGHRSGVVEVRPTDALDVVLENFAVSASMDADAVARSASDDGVERRRHGDKMSRRRLMKMEISIC